MREAATIFTVPTYRLRDVAEAIETYDEHFWSNGHSVKMMVFDDSSVATHEKYFPLLERTHTHNDVYYVGPREKEQFLGFLQSQTARQETRFARPQSLPPELRRKS
jgi:hypothetical protein